MGNKVIRTTDVRIPITVRDIGDGEIIFYGSTYHPTYDSASDRYPIPKCPENDHLLEEDVMDANRQDMYRRDSWVLPKHKVKLAKADNRATSGKFKKEGEIFEL